MAFDPFEGKVIRPFKAPHPEPPSNPQFENKKAQRAHEDAVQIAVERAVRCWLFPILGIGLWFLGRLVVRPLALDRERMEINAWVFGISKGIEWAAVIVMFAAAWFMFRAIWDWWKLKKSGRLAWRIGFGLPLNLMSALLTAQIICMEYHFDLWRYIERLVRGW